VATLSLALGIGATTTVFSILDTISLRPLPHHEPDRLVSISERDLDKPETEGGVVGHLTLMDGGMITTPSNAVYGPDGKWASENEGVAPDIEVEQDPAAVRAGHEPQLEKAIEVVVELLNKNPPPAIKRPPYKRLQR
jgi:hypothetical protein